MLCAISVGQRCNPQIIAVSALQSRKKRVLEDDYSAHPRELNAVNCFPLVFAVFSIEAEEGENSTTGMKNRGKNLVQFGVYL